eukprot:6188839-Prymnesium_polylepis.1
MAGSRSREHVSLSNVQVHSSACDHVSLQSGGVHRGSITRREHHQGDSVNTLRGNEGRGHADARQHTCDRSAR